MDSYNVVMLMFGVIFIIIQGLIVNYLVQLEKIGCECAMDWRKKFIVFFLVFSIVYTASTFFIDPASLPLLQTIVVVCGLTNVILTLQYVDKLKKLKCECSESVYRDVMTFIAIFNAILYSLILTLLVYFLFSMASYAKKGNFAMPRQKKQISIKPMKRK